ncbi:hypothetical protein [Ereboglobus sp. PH5-10]|uniref:hypothetical protein n=1 Tax=Ereboglobus sp. PH5-10 TaxID=2940629 RepID=UPI002404C359|nr:hypothetical protein [Ereboglobus sp. PH5-10]
MKVEAIREDLGSVGPVIAHQIVEAMSGKRTTIDTHAAEAQAAKARRFVVAERRLQEKIARLHDQLLETRTSFHLSADRIARAVQVALHIAEKPSLHATNWPGTPDGSVFHVPEIPGWERATEGLYHPHTGRRRPITFDHAVAKGRDDIVLAHLNHRLVQMCLRILRAEVWSSDERKRLHRVIVRRSADASLVQPVVVVSSRLLVTGGNHHQLHEELTLAGGELRADGFSRITQVGRIETLVEEARVVEPTNEVIADLRARFDRFEDPIRTAAEARSRERLRFLENTLERRKRGDIDDITGLLNELEATLRRELEPAKVKQLELSLGLENEKLQLRRDVAALQARLDRIPNERIEEIAAIERRYSDFAHRTFPVAVFFILPVK